MVEGGFLLRPRTEVRAIIAALAEKRFSVKEARVLLASWEMRAIREAAKRLRAGGKGRGEEFSLGELSKLTGLTLKDARSSEKRLLRAGYQLYSANGGSLPLPRRLVRLLAKTEKRSTFLTLLSYLERGMYLRRGKITAAGTVKASTLARTTNLSLRAVRMARQELLSEGILTPDTTLSQRKLNRTGAYFTVSLTWNTTGKRLPEANFAPPTVKKGGDFAPPIGDRKTPYGSRNQKTQRTDPAGVSSKPEGEGGKVLAPPTLRDVKRKDLEQFSRCERLYFEAIRAGWVKDSESARLNWFAAACRAKSAKSVKDPARVFVGIVRRVPLAAPYSVSLRV